MTVSTHTPGPWVWGEWDILPEDRDAQRRGEPFWTLREARIWGDLIQGPLGRKALDPERIVWAEGYETDGTNATGADKAMIAAAPVMYAALKELAQMKVAGVPLDEYEGHYGDTLRAAIMAAENHHKGG